MTVFLVRIDMDNRTRRINTLLILERSLTSQIHNLINDISENEVPDDYLNQASNYMIRMIKKDFDDVKELGKLDSK